MAAVRVRDARQQFAVRRGLHRMHDHARRRVDHEQIAVLAVSDVAQPCERLLARLGFRDRTAFRERRVFLDDRQTDMRDIDQIILAFVDMRLPRKPCSRHGHQQQRQEADDERQPQLLRETELMHLLRLRLYDVVSHIFNKAHRSGRMPLMFSRKVAAERQYVGIHATTNYARSI